MLARETGQSISDPTKLIAPMLERFMATDRAFAKARGAGQARSIGSEQGSAKIFKKFTRARLSLSDL
jgi:hypothetical protein